MSKLLPLSDKVVLIKKKKETTTPSGFVLPESAQKETVESEVLAVGPEVKTVKAGDSVLHSKYGPTEFELSKDEVVSICKEEDIYAVVVQ